MIYYTKPGIDEIISENELKKDSILFDMTVEEIIRKGNLKREIRFWEEAARKNQKLGAIWIYENDMKSSLREAKEAVERYMDNLRNAEN